MSQETLRTVTLERISFARFRVTNGAGDSIEVGEGGGAFSAVELLLAALASCSAADVDYITNKSAEPEKFALEARADKIRDEHGNRLTNVELNFEIEFPEGEAGDSARAVLPRAVAQSRDRLCTVARTLALPNELTFRTILT
ncbi:OsmC family protein [soil metagenome]